MDFRTLYGFKSFPDKPLLPFRRTPSDSNYMTPDGEYWLSFSGADSFSMRGAVNLEEAIAQERIEGASYDELRGVQAYQVLHRNEKGEIEAWEYEHEIIFNFRKIRKVELHTEVCHVCKAKCFCWITFEKNSHCDVCKESEKPHFQCSKCTE